MSRRGTAACLCPARLPWFWALAAVAIVVSGWPLSVGSAVVARAETQTISDGATVHAPDTVRVGQKLKISGRSWTTPAGRGSVIAIKFDEGDVTATAPVTNPATGDSITESTVVAAVRASSTGRFEVFVPLPVSAGWTAGTRHSVRLVTGKLLPDDATRSIALTFDVVARQKVSRPVPTSSPSSTPTSVASPQASEQPTRATTPSPSSDHTQQPTTASSREPEIASSSAPSTASSTVSAPSETVSPRAASTPVPDPRNRLVHRQQSTGSSGTSPSPTSSLATKPRCVTEDPTTTLTGRTVVRGLTVVPLGGSLTLTGSGFCGSPIGGAKIAVEIDDGRVARRDSTVDPDRRIWQVIEANDDGTFRATIRVPDEDQTDPSFQDGAHRLRLVTGSLQPGDPQRSVRTIEFAVATGNNAGVLPEPTSPPQPVDPTIALVGSKAGAVTAARSGSLVRVVVPDLEPGDWVYPFVFVDGRDPAKQTADWVQLDSNRTVALEVNDVMSRSASGARVSLQARDGSLVGWATVEPVSAQPVNSQANGESAGSSHPDTMSGTSGTGDEATNSEPSHSPRPLVVGSGIALLLIGIASLFHGRLRRRRALRKLNGE